MQKTLEEKIFKEVEQHQIFGNYNGLDRLTWDLRGLGTQIIALPSREQVTILS